MVACAAADDDYDNGIIIVIETGVSATKQGKGKLIFKPMIIIMIMMTIAIRRSSNLSLNSTHKGVRQPSTLLKLDYWQMQFTDHFLTSKQEKNTSQKRRKEIRESGASRATQQIKIMMPYCLTLGFGQFDVRADG